MEAADSITSSEIRESGLALRLGEQPLELTHREDVGQHLGLLRCPQGQRRVTQQPLLLNEEAEEALRGFPISGAPLRGSTDIDASRVALHEKVHTRAQPVEVRAGRDTGEGPGVELSGRRLREDRRRLPCPLDAAGPLKDAVKL